MISRLVLLVATLALVIGVATACTPEPAPTPSPTGFANEEQAFAAAEETYRAYVDALDQVDLSDPETFEAVYAWTTGEANANERKNLTQMHADGWDVRGSTAVTGFAPRSIHLGTPFKADAVVCTDVSEVQVVDASGQSMVSPNRPDEYAVEVTFVSSETTPTTIAIAASNAVEGESCN